MSEGDRLVDALREGIDCVVRVGKPRDSDMVARRLGELEEVTCAAPAYLQRFGTPQSLDDLRHHRMVGFRSSATGALMPLAFTVAGQAQPITLPATVSVSAAEPGRRRPRWASSGAALSPARRSGRRQPVAAAAGLAFSTDAGLAALSAQPPAVAAGARVSRLVQPGIRRAQSVVTECVTARRNSAAPSCTLRPGGSGSPTPGTTGAHHPPARSAARCRRTPAAVERPPP